MNVGALGFTLCASRFYQLSICNHSCASKFYQFAIMLPNSVCFSCSCNAGLKINVSLIQAISHGSRGVLHKMTSGRLVVVSRLDPLSLSCLIWGFLRPLRVLLSCPGVLASPPLYCCLFGFLGCPVPSYLPTCVYIYIYKPR